jgi:hypothetical protein
MDVDMYDPPSREIVTADRDDLPAKWIEQSKNKVSFFVDEVSWSDRYNKMIYIQYSKL